MSLPPGFLEDLRTRTSIAQVVGRKVVWDPRKSNQGKGDMWAPCPFHHEKTASFHVDDKKGYYYCFGCHAKGDAIGFVKETENVSFIEAVEILATEAGMQMPARDPKAREKADRRTQLIAVTEEAVKFFRLSLQTGAGQAARCYLAEQRGLGPDAWDRWEIGFAPDGWQNLWDHLTGKGIAEEMILACGLAKPSTTGKRPYDVFRNRIMFPIRDGRGRAIAFGGRAMDPADNAKYLNSPETELFDKSRTLFNLAPAREAAGKGQTLIVAEGYMDVIALGEAGFKAAVAPLGTAVTEGQLEQLWRVSDEPILALDGDTAGLRAADRVVKLALPLLQAGRALRFVILPDGKDPDDLLKDSGAEAMQNLLEASEPLVALLWRNAIAGRNFDSPERRAALDKALREELNRLTDPSLKRHYGEELRKLRADLFGLDQAGAGPRSGGWRPRTAPSKPLQSTRGSLLAQLPDGHEDQLRAAVILATLILHPDLLDQFEVELDRLTLDPAFEGLRQSLLRHDTAGDLQARLHDDAPGALETLLALPHVSVCPTIRRPGDTDAAAACIAGELAKLAARRGVEQEIAEAAEDLHVSEDEALTWRLTQAVRARDKAHRASPDDGDTLGEEDEALRQGLQALIDNQIWVRKKG